MKKILDEFKEFAVKGNMIDIAYPFRSTSHSRAFTNA
jgi:large-conductance mechanosensitive channel